MLEDKGPKMLIEHVTCWLVEYGTFGCLLRSQPFQYSFRPCTIANPIAHPESLRFTTPKISGCSDVVSHVPSTLMQYLASYSNDSNRQEKAVGAIIGYRGPDICI